MRLAAVVAFRSIPKTKAQVMAAWERGADFRALVRLPGWVGGPYFTVRDANSELNSLKDMGVDELTVPTEEGECLIDL